MKLTKQMDDSTNKRKAKGKDDIVHILADLQENHNHTWYKELYERNCKWLDDIALFYRGNHISYDTMFKNMEKYARALRVLGLHEGCEIPICLSNTPELVYLLGAISIIGAKANIFGTDFDHEYIVDIINSCDHTVLFIVDHAYLLLEDAIHASNIQKIVITSLVDSLLASGNPFEQYDKKHGQIKEVRLQCIGRDKRNINIDEFVALGATCEEKVMSDSGLDHEFIITYTSGSTNTTRPKAIVHTTRSLITIGRCHDPEIQKTASMKDFTVQAHIPVHSNTDIISSISDALMQGSKLALEPIYDKDFFIDSLLINQPTYVLATRSFWVNAAKKILFTKEYQDLRLPFMMIPFSVGEPLELNEEKLINRCLHKVKAGTNQIPLPFSVVTISVAGGDCEHGGIFWVVFRALQNKKFSNLVHKHEQGLMPFGMVEVAILDEKGNRCKPYQLGRLVANSPCTMKGYKNNPDATAAFFMKDVTGKVWGDCNVYSYMDKMGGIHIKGRIPDRSESIPLFQIADKILEDRKHILSCEVVASEGRIVAHVEFQPNVTSHQREILVKLKTKCDRTFGQDMPEILWRIRSFEEGFPLSGCGKRSAKALVAEGTSNCIKLS